MAKRKPAAKPAKPTPGFPLFPHANGQWAKKVRGRLHYFGPWADPAAALALYERNAADLRAGRTVRDDPDEVTVADAVNRFLAAKEAAHDAGELAFKSWRDYRGHRGAGGRRVRPAAAGVGTSPPTTFAGAAEATRRHAGPGRPRDRDSAGPHAVQVRPRRRSDRPAGAVRRRVQAAEAPHRAAGPGGRRGPRMFSPAEVRALLGGAAEPLRTMILLGVNGGFGPADCAQLPKSAVEFDAEGGPLIDFPRPKTEIGRRVPLWPETAAGLRACSAGRPRPKDPADGRLAFLTGRGNPWVRGNTDSVNLQFRKLRDRVGVGRAGLGFYALRHTFRTLADPSRDLVAVDAVMGHADHTMGGHYRETIDDARLRAVTDLVRSQILGG